MSAESAGVDERRLAIGAVQVLAVLAVPVAVMAAWYAGWQGAVSALIGLGFVLVLFGVSGALLAYAATRRPTGGAGILAVGAAVRVPLYLVALLLLERVPWIHGRSLAAATALAVAVTLAHELRLMGRMPRLFWIDATAARPSTAVNDTRSPAL